MIMLPPSYHRVRRIEIKPASVDNTYVVLVVGERVEPQEIAVIHGLSGSPLKLKIDRLLTGDDK